MKQGSGKSSMASGKTEPRAHAISVDKVANMGQQIIRTQPPSKDLYKGRGYEAPSACCSYHKSGSQGKH